VRLVIDPQIRADHDRLSALVRDGFQGVDASAVEVRLERARRAWESFTGKAYSGPTRRPRAAPGTAFVVRLWVPSVLRNRAYPKTYRYPGRSTAPTITVHDWGERLVALAAHEAFHVHQFREGLRRSEVMAERWADATLTAWRRRSIPPVAPTALVAAPGEGSGQLVLFSPSYST
jgi:hypothetical protein